MSDLPNGKLKLILSSQKWVIKYAVPWCLNNSSWGPGAIESVRISGFNSKKIQSFQFDPQGQILKSKLSVIIRCPTVGFKTWIRDQQSERAIAEQCFCNFRFRNFPFHDFVIIIHFWQPFLYCVTLATAYLTFHAYQNLFENSRFFSIRIYLLEWPESLFAGFWKVTCVFSGQAGRTYIQLHKSFFLLLAFMSELN